MPSSYSIRRGTGDQSSGRDNPLFGVTAQSVATPFQTFVCAKCLWLDERSADSLLALEEPMTGNDSLATRTHWDNQHGMAGLPLDHDIADGRTSKGCRRDYSMVLISQKFAHCKRLLSCHKNQSRVIIFERIAYAISFRGSGGFSKSRPCASGRTYLVELLPHSRASPSPCTEEPDERMDIGCLGHSISWSNSSTRWCHVSIQASSSQLCLRHLYAWCPVSRGQSGKFNNGKALIAVLVVAVSLARDSPAGFVAFVFKFFGCRTTTTYSMATDGWFLALFLFLFQRWKYR